MLLISHATYSVVALAVSVLHVTRLGAVIIVVWVSLILLLLLLLLF